MELLCRTRPGTAASLPLPSTFVPAAAGSGPRPPGAPRFFVPGAAAQSANAGSGWGQQPSIPEAAAQLPEQSWGQPAGVQAAAWGAQNGSYAASIPASIPEVPAGQDLYTSYAELQPQWPEAAAAVLPPPGKAAHQPAAFAQPGFGYGTSGRTQGLQDGELTEIQL